MKTAMQWLEENMFKTDMPSIYYVEFLELIKEAKEKEKEQIIEAHIEGQRVFDNYHHTQWTNDQADIYYNQTYNQNK